MFADTDLFGLLRSGLHIEPGMLWGILFGVTAAVLTVVSNLMKRMVPLRTFAVAATAFFIVYALLVHEWVNLGLQTALLFINTFRLWDLKRLLKQMEEAKADAPVQDWLLPHMKKKKFKAGHVLFKRGDIAHEIVYIAKGTVIVEEIGHTLGSGSLVGEIGLFTEDRKRTATIACQTDCVCYVMTDEAIHLLYFQNPALGFYLIRLIVQRLLKDLQRRPEVAA